MDSKHHSVHSSMQDETEIKLDGESYDPSITFRHVKEDFGQIIQDLMRHDRLGQFTNEFQRLMEALKESHTREKELSDKNKTLHQHVESSTIKYAEALKVTQADRETIDKLQKEVTKAWRMVDTAHTREQLAQETIDNLRLQASRLTQELETLRKMGSDQDQEVGAISKNKEALAREKERLLMEIQNAKEKYANSVRFQEELERKNEALELRLAEVTTDLEAQKSDLAKEKRFKEKLEEEVKELRNDIVIKDQELLNQTNQATQCTKNSIKMELQLREDKLMIDKQNKEMQELQNAYRLQKMEFEQISGNLERLQQEFTAKTQEIKLKEDDISKMKSELKKMGGIKDSLENKLCSLKNEKGTLEMKRKDMATRIVAFEKEVSDMSKTLTSDKKKMDVMNREKEMMSKRVQRATAFTQEQQKFIALQELNQKKLQDELQDHIDGLTKQRAEISGLQNENDRFAAEVISLNTQVQNQLEELKLKEMELFDFKKRVTSTDAKIKLQSAMFEQVRSERNQLSKTLAEANDEINELKHKLKIKSYQVQQLKEDIQTKDNLLVKEEFTVKRITKEKEEVKGEHQKTLNELKEKKDQVVLLTQDESRLQKIIQEGDRDRVKLNKDLNQVSNERDILGTQLVRRNDELALLYEKIRILESVLHKGEAQYGQRVEDIRLLKIEVKKLRQEKAMLARSMDNIADLRQEIFHLERDFIKEKLKCRALEEELQNPLNVHRWRKLEGSDPTTYELIQKIQILQRRLLAANEEAIKRESQLKETERLYLNLKQLLARQPGPEIFGKLKKCQNAFKQRGVKMKCLIAELTMFENQISGYKFEKQQTDKELYQLKKQFYEMKKREHKVKLREKELAQEKTFLPVLEPITGKPMRARFVGAGFNVATVPCVPRTPAIRA